MCINKYSLRQNIKCRERRIEIPCDCKGDMTIEDQNKCFPERLSGDHEDSL